VEVKERGYVEGEWFCKDYQDNGTTNKKALEIFNEINSQLNSHTLYKFYCKGKCFEEIPFDKL